MKKLLLLCSFLTLLLHPTQAQKAGELDPTFGKNGIAKLQFKAGNLGNEQGTQLFVQPDGRIIALTRMEGAVTLCRYNTDGSVDMTYGSYGYSVPLKLTSRLYYEILPDIPAAMQPDGKVVVGWNVYSASMNYQSYLVRFNTDGSLDKTFGTVSIYNPLYFHSKTIAIQADGKILVGGFTEYVNMEQDQVFAVVRLNSDGSRDDSFGTGGYVLNYDYGYFGYAFSIALQSDSKILVLGESGGTSFLARYKTNGDLDHSFNLDGILDPFFPARAVTVQPDNKILLAGPILSGSSYKLEIRRYSTIGLPDNSFSGDGKLTTNASVPDPGMFTLALQSNGKILASAATNTSTNPGLLLVRVSSTGTQDLTFDSDGKLVPDFRTAPGFTLLPADKIGFTGYVQNALNKDIVVARYNSNGGLDPTFDGDGKNTFFYRVSYSSFIASAIQQDGKLVALANSFNGKSYERILTRFTSKGNRDTTFDHDGKMLVDSAASIVAIQPGPKIILADTASSNSSRLPMIECYNSDGSRNRLFGVGGKITHQNSSIVAIAIQKDGKIVVAGNTLTGGNYNFAVTRYNSNGTLDLSFGNNGSVTTDFGSSGDLVKSVAIQKDGKIVVSGLINAADDYDFSVEMAFARYNTNGSPDNTFDEDGKSTFYVYSADIYLMGGLDTKGSLAIQEDGKILAAGEGWTEVRYELSPVYYTIVRFNSDGSPDGFFGQDRYREFGSGSNPKLQIDHQSGGKVIVSINPDNVSNYDYPTAPEVFRYNTDGSLDPTFKVDNKGLSEINEIIVGNNRLYTVGAMQGFLQHHSAISSALLQDNQLPLVQLIVPNHNTTSTARLEGAIPNPAQGHTLIRYYLPANSATAQLFITSMNGQVLQILTLNNRGAAQVSVNTSALPAGTYAYSLYVDGKLAGTKQLLVTR